MPGLRELRNRTIRQLRKEARRHVREEVPFFTGRRIQLDQIPEVLA